MGEGIPSVCLLHLRSNDLCLSLQPGTAEQGKTESSLGQTIGDTGAESSRQLQFQMQPGREVRHEMLIAESLHTQNEMLRQKADTAKWVPVGRDGLKDSS